MKKNENVRYLYMLRVVATVLTLKTFLRKAQILSRVKSFFSLVSIIEVKSWEKPSKKNVSLFSREIKK